MANSAPGGASDYNTKIMRMAGPRLGECPLWRATRALAGIGGSQRGWPVRDVR